MGRSAGRLIMSDPLQSTQEPSGLRDEATLTTSRRRRRRRAGGIAYVVRRLGHVGPLAGLTVLLPIVGGVTLVVYQDEVGGALGGYEAAAPLIFIGIATVLGAFSILPTHGLSLIGGYVFGFTLGLPVTLTAIVFASGIGYAVKRLISRERVMGLIREKPQSLAVHQALVGGGFWWSTMIVTLIRLSPAAPFAMTNLVMAATGVRVPPFLLGTAVGMMPRCAAVVATGAMTARLGEAEDAGHVAMLVIGIVATIVAVVVLSVASRRALRRVTGSSL